MIVKGKFFQVLKIKGEKRRDEVLFEMDIKISDGSFSGTHLDAQSKDHIDSDTFVNGFIEKEFISFTVEYPYNYYIDYENDELIVEMDFPHPGVTYSGYLDPSDNKFKGNWFIKFNEVKENLFQTDFFIDDEIYGDWEMENKFI